MFFKAISGWPCVKSEELRNIAQTEGVPPAGILMVGDSCMDRRAAEDAGAACLYLDPDTRLNVVLDRLEKTKR